MLMALCRVCSTAVLRVLFLVSTFTRRGNAFSIGHRGPGRSHLQTRCSGAPQSTCSVLRWKDSIDRMRSMFVQSEGKDETGMVVISDFDRTLSMFRGIDGRQGEECHDIIFNHAGKGEQWNNAIEKLWADSRANFPAYNEMQGEVKHRFCEWWWREANRIILEHKITKDDIRNAALKSNTLIRRGCTDLIKECVERDIPLVIVSAGFSDIIEVLLERDGVDTSRIIFHANRMKFDSAGVVEGFHEFLVHSMNKAFFIKNMQPHIQELLQSGRRALILGDNIADTEVVKGLEFDATVKVGLANCGHEDEELMLKHYDAIVAGDGDLLPVVHLLKELVTAKGMCQL